MSIDESWEQSCTTPPAPSGAALIAAADGEADEATLEHLRICPTCMARVMHLRTLQGQLRRQLYRLHCLSSDTLIDYCQGLLEPHVRAVAAHHIATCPHCAAEVSLLEHSAPLARAIGVGRRGRLIAPFP